MFLLYTTCIGVLYIGYNIFFAKLKYFCVRSCLTVNFLPYFNNLYVFSQNSCVRIICLKHNDFQVYFFGTFEINFCVVFSTIFSNDTTVLYIVKI